jgi:hypothetical protein
MEKKDPQFFFLSLLKKKIKKNFFFMNFFLFSRVSLDPFEGKKIEKNIEIIFEGREGVWRLMEGQG